MSEDVGANIERDLMQRKAARFWQPSMHVSLPEFTQRYAPAQHSRPMKESPRIRSIVAAGVLTVLEQRGWPTVRIGALGGEQAHNSRWSNTALSGEQEWRQFLAVVDLGEVRRLGRLLAAAPEMFASPTKPAKRTGRKTTEDEDERFLDALKGEV